MPIPLLNAYADQLPRLMADEALQTFQHIAAGTGRLKRGATRQLIATWERQAHQERVVIRPRTRAMYEAQMAMAGIGVKRVPKGG